MLRQVNNKHLIVASFWFFLSFHTSLWRCQMLVTEHLTNVARLGLTFETVIFISVELSLRGVNAAPYFVSPSVATVERNALVNRWTYCIYQWTRRNVKEELYLQLSTLLCPLIPSGSGVHIQSYHLCLSESKYKTKKYGQLHAPADLL